MKKTLTAVAATALLATSALANDTTSIKPIVGAFLGAVLQGDVDTMHEMANADYIQQNPFIPTGLEPFIKRLPVLQEAGTTAKNIRMFEDGNYVLMHNIWRNAAPLGADTMVSFDIIRVDENGRVAEHWDALQPLVTETASGRTQTDGPTEVTDLDQADANKALAVSEGQWNGTTTAFYDLFRMEDGMIVEHWDVIQPVPTEGLANDNGMFTGFDGVGPESIGQLVLITP